MRGPNRPGRNSDHGTDRPYGFDRLRFVPLLELLRTLAHVLVVALARKRLLVPVQELRGRIDLVVVLAFRGPTAAARRLQTVRIFGRWDCINAYTPSACHLLRPATTTKFSFMPP